MALTVKEIEELRAYLNGVMDRANHHAGPVKEIALALAGAILWRKDDDKPLKVMVRNGETKNVLWVYINGLRYAFTYDHGLQQIEMRNDNLQGAATHTFTNATPLSDVYRVFNAL